MCSICNPRTAIGIPSLCVVHTLEVVGQLSHPHLGHVLVYEGANTHKKKTGNKKTEANLPLPFSQVIRQG